MEKFALILLTASLFFSAQAAKPLPTVPNLDINRYLGAWYEIARVDNRFQKDCYGSMANYSLRDDGDIRVINTCRVGSLKGKLKKVEGRAWVVDKKVNSKLKIQFFLTGIRLSFAASKYWIIELDKDYQYAVVGHPDRDYLWILSRTKTLDDSTYQHLLKRSREMGFDTKTLVKTIQE